MAALDCDVFDGGIRTRPSVVDGPALKPKIYDTLVYIPYRSNSYNFAVEWGAMDMSLRELQPSDAFILHWHPKVHAASPSEADLKNLGRAQWFIPIVGEVGSKTSFVNFFQMIVKGSFSTPRYEGMDFRGDCCVRSNFNVIDYPFKVATGKDLCQLTIAKLSISLVYYTCSGYVSQNCD